MLLAPGGGLGMHLEFTTAVKGVQESMGIASSEPVCGPGAHLRGPAAHDYICQESSSSESTRQDHNIVALLNSLTVCTPTRTNAQDCPPDN